MSTPIRVHRSKGTSAARDDHGRKECRTCHRWFDTSAFSRGPGLDGLDSRCRLCKRRYVIESHGLTIDGFHSLLDQQGGSRPGCGRTPADAFERTWHVDHDHACCPGPTSCGKCVRGILCFSCNAALGQAKDDPAILRALADYVERTAQLKLS